MQECHDIDLEIPLKHLWLDLQETSESAADGVVHNDLRRAVGLMVDPFQGLVQCCLVRNVRR
jgi:hypothetical protein